VNILIVSGTNREGSMSLRVAQKMAPLIEAAGGTPRVLDLRELPADIFQPTAYGKGRPASFDPFQQAVLDADGILFIVPEYNGSYPGVLKYFIDMWSYPDSFEGRCVAYIGLSAGPWGALRSVEHLQGVMGYRNAWQFNERVFIPSIFQRWGWEDGSIGKLNEKEYSIEELLESQARNFVAFCGRQRG